MVDIKLLQDTIYESGMTYKALARKSGISRATLYNRINEKHGEFTISQIEAITEALHLSREDREKIFFAQG